MDHSRNSNSVMFFLLVLFFTNGAFASGKVNTSFPSMASGLDTCFSPQEACDQKLIGMIQAANSSLDIAVYSITHSGIVSALLQAKDRGVQIRMVVDRGQGKGQGSLVNALTTAGVALKFGHVGGLMHNKFTIFDTQILETGSYNYTMNATLNNAENQLYLSDLTIINKYQEDFDRLWSAGYSPKSELKPPAPTGP